MKKSIYLFFTSCTFALLLMGCGHDVNYIISNEPYFRTTVIEVHKTPQRYAYFVGTFEAQEAHISLNPEHYSDSYLNFQEGDRVMVFYDGYYEDGDILVFDNIYLILETEY